MMRYDHSLLGPSFLHDGFLAVPKTFLKTKSLGASRHGKIGQTRLSRNPIDPFKNDPFWPVTCFDSQPD